MSKQRTKSVWNPRYQPLSHAKNLQPQKESLQTFWITQTQTSSRSRHLYDKRRDKGLIRPEYQSRFQSGRPIYQCRNSTFSHDYWISGTKTSFFAPLPVDLLSCRTRSMKIFIEYTDKTSNILYFVQIGSERETAAPAIGNGFTIGGNTFRIFMLFLPLTQIDGSNRLK